MTDPLVVVLLGVLATAAVAMTGIALVTALELRRMLRRLDAFLPTCDATVRETRRVMTQARHLLTRTTEAAGQVEGVVGRVCATATQAMEQFGGWGTSVQQWFQGQTSNGAGSRGSRRQTRR